MKKTVKSWRKLFFAQAIICLIAIIVSLFLPFDTVKAIVILAIAISIGYLGLCLYFKPPSIVDGLSNTYLIKESCQGVEVYDQLGANNQDILDAQAALKTFKTTTGFEFKPETLFDQLVVKFTDDAKSKIVVHHLENTRIIEVEGITQLKGAELKVGEFTFNVYTKGNLAVRLDVLKKYWVRDKRFKVKIAKPIVYNKELSGIDKDLSDILVDISEVPEGVVL